MNKKILVLGGDERQLYAADNFIKNGFKTAICGFSEIKNSSFENKEDIFNEISKADIILLPMPLSKDWINLNAPLNKNPIPLYDIYEPLKEKKVYGGIVSDTFHKKVSDITDYSSIEALVLKNAALTAEAAMSIIISSTPFGILGNKILITGYGRIGKILAGYIKAFGGIPVVCARKESDFALCDINSISHTRYEDLKEIIKDFKVVINTVPEKVITDEIISNADKNCFFIDLASMGGGFDFESLKKRNIKYVHALSLPGKFSPLTAGQIISDIIIKNEKD